MSYMDRVRACNGWSPEDYLPLRCEGETVGRVRRSFARHLGDWPEILLCTEGAVEIHPRLEDAESRSVAMAEVIAKLTRVGHIAYLLDEPYPVTAAARKQTKFVIDRGAAPYFGIRAFGQHINGYVREEEGIRMWIGRRAADRINFPSRLDNLAAGGLPYGIGLRENLAKECQEEAGIRPEVAARAVSVSAITYCRETEKGLKPGVLYCYDLALSEGFVPHAADGEMAGFELLSLEEVARIVRESDEFKPNCALVVIDFLIRHGFITPEDPDYQELLCGLHAPLP